MPRLPMSRSGAISREDTHRSRYTGSQCTSRSFADSDWDYSIGAPSLASPRFVPDGVPPLDLPSPRSDWSESVFGSVSTSSFRHNSGFAPGVLHMNSQMKRCPSESEMSEISQRNQWPGLEERRWRPHIDHGIPSGAMPSSRSDRSSHAARHLHNNRGGQRDSKESATGSETASWWSSIMPGASCTSTVASIPTLNGNVTKLPPKERNCDEKIKERARGCSGKLADRQCRFAQECEDGIEEILFRDATQEVVEEPYMRPPTDSCNDRPRPNTLGTLKKWSPQS